MANVEKLLHRSPSDGCFFSQLELHPHEDQKLRAARREIRQCLRKAFSEADVQRFGGAKIKPAFFTQGSFAYKTLNRPAFSPPQQMDMDDGCYLPLSFIQQARPSVAANAFFEFMDTVLQDLARAKGWMFIGGKPTCCRLELDDSSHVDIPLYAIPDREHERLLKAATEALATTASAVNLSEAMRVRTVDRWDLLPSNDVLLAHREEGWKVSDPRKIHEWFEGEVEHFGERLRRICRYLKAWRDYNYASIDGVSSILLMACASEAFNQHDGNIPPRDDQALALVARKLPALLSGVINNPADPEGGEDLAARLGDRARQAAINTARDLSARLDGVIQHCFDSHRAVDTMRGILGDRIPQRPDWVGVADGARAEVLSRPAVTAPIPIVGRSTSA